MALIKQGYMIFPQSTSKKHFKFNSGLFSMMMGDYKKAVKKYLELYYHVAKDVKPRVRANEANED